MNGWFNGIRNYTTWKETSEEAERREAMNKVLRETRGGHKKKVRTVLTQRELDEYNRGSRRFRK